MPQKIKSPHKSHLKGSISGPLFYMFNEEKKLLSRYFYPLHHSFLLFPTISLILGILWFRYEYYVPILIIFLFLCIILYFFVNFKHLILIVFFMPLGALLTHYQWYCFEQFHLSYNRMACTVEGSILEKDYNPENYYPHLTKVSASHIFRGSRHNLGSFKITSGLNNRSNSQILHKTISIYSKQPLEGDIMDKIKLEHIIINSIESPSYKDYLIRNDIYVSCFVKKLKSKIVNHPKYSFWRWVYQTRYWLHESFQKKLTPITYNLFATLFLGHKSTNKKMSSKFKKLFNVWGISHHLARSGLHVVIIIFLLEFFLRQIPIYYTKKQLLIIILICIYQALSWSTVSFNRAIYTFLLCKLALISWVAIDLVHIIILTCMLTLLLNPYHLFFLDFQLSFGLTMAIGWLQYLRQIKNCCP